MTASDFRQYANRLAAWTALVGAVLSVAALLISKPVALGLLFGVAAGFVKMKLATRGLLQFADTGGRGSVIGLRVMNYFLIGAVLFVAFSTPHLNQWAALAGVVLPNVLTVFDAVCWASGNAAQPSAHEGR